MTIVALFAAPLQDLYGLLDARIEQLREQGDTSEAAATTDEPTAEAEPTPSEGGTGAHPSPADTGETTAEPTEAGTQTQPASDADASEAEREQEEQ
jgi:hypothetical protein